MKFILSKILFTFAVTTVLFFSSCKTLPPVSQGGSNNPSEGLPYAPAAMSGDLWDVNNGVRAGSYDLKRNGSGFSLYIQTEETKGKTLFDGTKTFAPFEGVFEGSLEPRTKDAVIYGNDENENYYVIIYNLSEEALPKAIAEAHPGKKSFLLTVMDRAIFEEVVLQKKAEPRSTIQSLTPFMRTQAVISQ